LSYSTLPSAPQLGHSQSNNPPTYVILAPHPGHKYSSIFLLKILPPFDSKAMHYYTMLPILSQEIKRALQHLLSIRYLVKITWKNEENV
jgi:hypothetical protein